MTMSAQKAQQPVELDPVTEAARAALDAADGDVREASKRMEQAVRSNRGLRDRLTDPLIAEACYAAVSAQCRAERRRIWSPPASTVARAARDGARRVARLAADSLLAFPLPGGLKLGEATRAEIVNAAGFFERQAGDMAHKARWLTLVAQAMPGRKKASQVLTEERLRELQQEARAHV